MLGADGLTLAAADAVNGLFGIREAGCPLLADGVLLTEHPELIPDAEIVRNVHAHGAGHTVAAAGAADFDVAAQDVGSLPDGGVLGVGHGEEISEGGEVVVQLVFCAHAGEDDLHVFVAGRPAQRPRGRAASASSAFSGAAASGGSCASVPPLMGSMMMRGTFSSSVRA